MMGKKRPEADTPKSASFYLSQVNLREAWNLLKGDFAQLGCLVFMVAVGWLLVEFFPKIIPEEVSRGIPNIPDWVWSFLVVIFLWSQWGGRKISIPSFSKKRLLLVSIWVGGVNLILKYLPRSIGIPLLVFALFLVAYVLDLVAFGKRKYEEGIGPADSFYEG